MKKRLLVLLVLAAMALTLFAACEEKKSSHVTEAEAIQIAIEASGVSKNSITEKHSHIGTVDNIPVYNIHLTYDGVEHEFVINGLTGEVISKD